jgi:septum formation protein
LEIVSEKTMSAQSSGSEKLVFQSVVLASSSPFRKKLLAATGLSFVVQTADVDEYALTGATPSKTCRKRARAKALAVAEKAPQSLVIGCDQILALDGRSFDKARDPVEAADRLRFFAGRTHHLINQIVLTHHNQETGQIRELLAIEVAVPMSMRSLTDAEIKAYVATGEWQGCVGCYQFENRGVNLFEHTTEDHSAIVGLPLQPLLAALRRLGVNPLTNPTGPWQGY